MQGYGQDDGGHSYKLGTMRIGWKEGYCRQLFNWMTYSEVMKHRVGQAGVVKCEGDDREGDEAWAR